MEYGTGAVMSVPGHDERDFEFAQKYSLPIKQVIAPVNHEQVIAEPVPTTAGDASAEMKHSFAEYGVLINSGEWGGKLSQNAMVEMAEHARKNKFGEAAVTYRIRDWGISRQRFWGAPVPIIYCKTCGMVPVPYDQLPVMLPDNAAFTGTGESPLAGVPEFVNTTCPKCQ
jgi:leucyl-tRNA synthetase